MVESRWQAVAALVDPVRRALYDHVRRQTHPVSRDEAADAVAITRNLAAFHLDKLVDAGLLRARYQAPAGQPRGRGRTPKVYELAGNGVAVTMPQREYERVAAILAEAVAKAPTDAARAALRTAAAHGRRLGSQYAIGDEPDPLGRLGAVLTELGYEPTGDPVGGLVLRNCPFHALASHHPELVCGLNHAFITGLLAGMGLPELVADLRPEAGLCCVAVRPDAGRRSGARGPDDG